MNKRIIVRIFNTLCLLSAIFLLVAFPPVIIAGQYWKATRPCFLQFLFGQVPIACAMVLFLISACPARIKVNPKFPDVEKWIDSLLILSCCFAALDFFFLMRIEFFGGFSLLSPDMEKLLALMFYGLVYLFFKTKNYYLRITAMIVGVINIIYIPVYNNLFYENNVFTIFEVSRMLPFFVYILMLSLFVSLERAVFSTVPSKRISSSEYFIGRHIASDGSSYALLMHSRYLTDISLYSFKSGNKWRAHSLTHRPDEYITKNDQIELYTQLRKIRREEYKNNKELL